jgi:hypothetical protein
LLTLPWCIPAHPVKLTASSNAKIKFATLFISRPPFPISPGLTSPPHGHPILSYRWDNLKTQGNKYSFLVMNK